LDDVVDIGFVSFAESIEDDVPLLVFFLKLSDISFEGAFAAVITVDIIRTLRLVDDTTTFTSRLLSVTLRWNGSAEVQSQ
jgi:hypothetical protein